MTNLSPTTPPEAETVWMRVADRIRTMPVAHRHRVAQLFMREELPEPVCILREMDHAEALDDAEQDRWDTFWTGGDVDIAGIG